MIVTETHKMISAGRAFQAIVRFRLNNIKELCLVRIQLPRPKTIQKKKDAPGKTEEHPKG
jgi:hypothetical protein